MAIQVQIKRELNAEMIHAVVRMDEKTHKLLKTYMHCKDGIAIRFPQRTALFSRGRGWYRLECANEKVAIQSILFAVKTIRRFIADQEREVEEQIKLLAPIMKNPDLRVVSFSNAHSEGEFGYMGIAKQRPNTTAPASSHQLARLAQKFNVQRKA